nr:thiamine pyrophosphate-binding protein [Marinobacter sp. C7]
MILEYLEKLGVECVFGVPGGSIEPFYNAMARSMRRGGVRPVTARHETGAAFMADGYARASGKLGVVCSTAGPGATNLITGVAAAYSDNVPVLVITAQTSLKRFGQGALQESSCTSVDTLRMLAECTLYNSLVSHPEQLEPKLLQAISVALGPRPGPVHLSIPNDVMRHPLGRDSRHRGMNPVVAPMGAPDETGLQEAQALLDDARNVTLVLGERAEPSVRDWVKLAEARRWNMVTTPRAKGLLNSYHPLNKGVFGFAGHESATTALSTEYADRIVLVGSGLDEVTTSGWNRDALMNERLIHVSDHPGHLYRSAFAACTLLGETGALARRLLESQSSVPEPAVEIPVPGDGLPGFIKSGLHAGCLAQEGPIKPQALMTQLSKVCPDNAHVLFDSGNSYLWGIHHWNTGTPAKARVRGQPFYIGIGFSSMAWAIGASVGVAAAAGGAPVLCFTGDGSYLMSGQELTTALQENLNVLMVVLNDSALGMVRHGQSLGGGEPIANELPRIDYAAMAAALGIESRRISSMESLMDLDIRAIMDRPGPFLLDVVIDREQVPPMGSRIKVLTGAH